MDYFKSLTSGNFTSESSEKVVNTIKVYRDRLVNLNSKNRSLVLKKLYNKRAFDLTKVFQADIYDIRNFIIERKDGKILLSNSVDKKLDEDQITLAVDIEKNLFALKSEIELVEKERGSNDLYIGYPFVEGYFKDETFVRAPLLLFPVNIVKEDYRWNLSNRLDEDVIMNRSFALANEKYNELKINEELLDFEEYDSKNLIKWLVEYLGSLGIEVNCSNMSIDSKTNPIRKFENYTNSKLPQIKNGTLNIENHIILGQFPVAGSAIYEDYKQLIKEKCCGRLVDELLGDNTEDIEANKDINVKEEDLNLVSELDYSQEKAIISANQNRNLVIYGPPGTGKSQVIVNMIANSLAKGEKVLMVSQKKAALDVVYKRLLQFGFGDFTGYVHDYNQDRKNVYLKIASMIDNNMEFDVNNRDYNKLSCKIDENIGKLDDVANLLHKKTRVGLSLRYMLANSINSLEFYSEALANKFDLFINMDSEELDGVLRTLEENKVYFKYDFKSNPLSNRKEFSDIQSLEKQKLISYLKDISVKLASYSSNLGFIDKVSDILDVLPSLIKNLEDYYSNCFNEEKNSFIRTLNSKVIQYQKSSDNNIIGIWKSINQKINSEIEDFDKTIERINNSIKRFENYTLLLDNKNAEKIDDLFILANTYKESKWYQLKKLNSKKVLKAQVGLGDINKIVETVFSTHKSLNILRELRSQVVEIKIEYNSDHNAFMNSLKNEKERFISFREELKKVSKLEIAVDGIKNGNYSLYNNFDTNLSNELLNEYDKLFYVVNNNELSHIKVELKELKTSLENYYNNCVISANVLKANKYLNKEIDEEHIQDVFNRVEIIKAFEDYDKYDNKLNETAISKVNSIVDISIKNKKKIDQIAANIHLLRDFSKDIVEKIIDNTLLSNANYVADTYYNILSILIEDVSSNSMKADIENLMNLFSSFREETKNYTEGANKILDSIDSINKYFSSNFIYDLKVKVLNNNSIMDAIEKVGYYIKNEFDDIVSYDINKTKFTATEKNMFEIIQNECGEDIEKIRNSPQIIKNTTYLIWIEETRKENIDTLFLIGQECKLRDETYEMMLAKKSMAQKYIKKKIYTKASELPQVYGKMVVRRFKAEALKKRRILPLRKYIREFFNQGLSDILPCWLVTPEVASAIFPLRQNLFDLVVFDEASQMYVENAVPIIYRSKRVVVAGDDKQLQPSDLYAVKLDVDSLEEEVDEDEYTDNLNLEEKSLLDLTKHKYDSVSLSYHYRSNSEQLIAFSNNAFYNGDVQIVPNLRKSDIPPIERALVSGRWIDKKNNEEAKYVVKLVKHILENRKNNESMGIITFNSTQQDHIIELLDKECIKDPEFATLYLKEMNNIESEDKSLFIKNIENVQGDERDIIIFSIGYGKDEKGRVIARFGLLNQDGGENRLNVAISRAKKKIYVVTSIEPEELSVENSKNRGPKLLKEYLKYVRVVSNGDEKTAGAVLEGLISNESSEPKIEYTQDSYSLFENELYEALVNLGYTVRRKVGVSGYKIDLAIYHEEKDTYILGIECDGKMYYSSPSARERDIYRRKFFEARGWAIYRVWSLNWWKDSKKEIERITELIKENIKKSQSEVKEDQIKLLPYETKENIISNIQKTAVISKDEKSEIKSTAKDKEQEKLVSINDKKSIEIKDKKTLDIKEVIIAAIMQHKIIKQRKDYRFRYDILKDYVEKYANCKIKDVDFIKVVQNYLSEILYYDKNRDVFLTVYDTVDLVEPIDNGEELTYTDKLLIKRQKGEELSDWEEQWLIDTRNSMNVK